MKIAALACSVVLFSLSLTAFSASAGTIVVGGRVANVYTVSEIEERLSEQEKLSSSEECVKRKESERKSPSKAEPPKIIDNQVPTDVCGLPINEFFVCRCQIYKHSFNNPNPVDKATGAIVLEDAGAWNPISLAITVISLPIEKSDLVRAIELADIRGCQAFWSHCKVNILFVRIPDTFTNVKTWTGTAKRPVFRMAIDYTGEKNTFIDVWAKGALWYLDFSKKLPSRPTNN